MKLNKFVFLGAIAIIVALAIAAMNSARFEEEKRIARSRVSSVLRVGCASRDPQLRLADYAEERVAKNPENEQAQESAKTTRESANKSESACREIQELREKYNF